VLRQPEHVKPICQQHQQKDNMIITSLPFPKSPKTPAKDYKLPADLYLEQWIVPEGTTIKLKTSENFGLVILPEGCKDKRGFTMPQRLFQW
jgi:hypothetical protein